MHERRFFVIWASVLCVALSSLSSYSLESNSPESLFEHAEARYRQLQVVDPEIENVAAWSSVALAFSEITERYPTNPLAGDALWRVADIHSRQLEHGASGAMVNQQRAFQALVRQYPASAHAPEALLRLALAAAANRGSKTEAASLYYRLLQRYPGTPQAELARRHLAGSQPPEVTSSTWDSSPADGSEAVVAAAFASDEGFNPAANGSQAGTAPITSAEPGTTAVDPIAGLPVGEMRWGRLTGVRQYSDESHTRVVFDMDAQMRHVVGEAQQPPRLFVDIIGAELPKELARKIAIEGGSIEQVRLAVNRPGIVRAVLDLTSKSAYSLFTLENPHRLVIDIPSPEMTQRLANARRPEAANGDSVARQLHLSVRRVVLDPGHGGSAPGAIGRTGITEKDLALDIATRLAAQLREHQGYEVIMTRDSDTTVSLEERTEFANRLQADLFVSLHVNSSNNHKLSGFETYFLDLATEPTAAETAARENSGSEAGLGNLDRMLERIVQNDYQRESRDLAQAIQDSLVLQMSKNYEAIRDLGVKQAPFVVLVGSEMPSVLVETSFLSNGDEEQRLRDPAYRQRIAEAIHIGMQNFIELRQPPVYAEYGPGTR